MRWGSSDPVDFVNAHGTAPSAGNISEPHGVYDVIIDQYSDVWIDVMADVYHASGLRSSSLQQSRLLRLTS
jgi:hypothetical protein